MATAFLLCSTLTASAQTVSDGSGAGIPPDELKAMLGAAMLEFRDPDATQFRDLQFEITKGQENIRGETLTTDTICGLVNEKNQFGGYEGFKKFRYATTDKKFSIGYGGCR